MSESKNSFQFDDDPDIDAEIQAALGDQSLDDLMAAAEPSAPAAPADRDESVDPNDPMAAATRHMPSVPTGRINPGDRVSARVIMVGRDDVFVELGPKRQGVCGREQFADEPPSPGDVVDFIMNRYDASESLFYLTRVGSVSKADWEHLQIGQVVEARCTGTNKGGLEMEVANHRAFMPAGQVGIYRIEDFNEYIGQTLTCEVIEFNREKKNIVLSAREVLMREQAEAKEKMWEVLEVGQSVSGVVRKLMPFGAFVDLGGVDGLIHISDLSYSRVNNAGDVVSEGQSVTVQILKIDRENDRIGLGLKQCQADPFQSVTDSIQPGDTVTGRVTRIADFGAFVELQPGVEGLVHISELSHDRVNRVDQVVKKDEIVTAQVLDMDPDSRRISLSIKAMTTAQDAMQERPEDASIARLRARFGDGSDLKGGIF